MLAARRAAALGLVVTLAGGGCGNRGQCSCPAPPAADGGPESAGDARLDAQADAATDAASEAAVVDAAATTDAGCTPRTCEGAGMSCGFVPDGCGSVLNCGQCRQNTCECQPSTCDELNAYACGPQADGCGTLLECGACSTAAGPCIPVTCKDYGSVCGQQADGCGGLTLNCGTCTNPQYCGGGGPSQCGPVTSTICAELGSNCGEQEPCGDGVVFDCGTCPEGEYCDGTTCGGAPLDGGSGCVPLTCNGLGYDCGTASDGCGGTLTCGTCAPPDTCSGGGSYNVCGTVDYDAGCAPSPCDRLGIGCGPTGDGRGSMTIECGSGCSLQEIGACGGGGTPFECGSGGTCTPITCAQLGYNCGYYGDGCGGLLQCGTCAPPDFCGAGGFDRCGADAGARADGG